MHDCACTYNYCVHAHVFIRSYHDTIVCPENIHVSRVEKIDLLLLTHAKSLDVVVKAAAAGDVSSLVDYLKKNPHEVKITTTTTTITSAIMQQYLLK